MTETGHTWLWKHGESTLYCGNGPNFWLTNITYGEFNFFFFFSSAIWNKSDCLFLPMGTRHYEVNKLTSLRKMKKNVSALCLFLSSGLNKSLNNSSMAYRLPGKVIQSLLLFTFGRFRDSLPFHWIKIQKVKKIVCYVWQMNA